MKRKWQKGKAIILLKGNNAKSTLVCIEKIKKYCLKQKLTKRKSNGQKNQILKKYRDSVYTDTARCKYLFWLDSLLIGFSFKLGHPNTTSFGVYNDVTINQGPNAKLTSPHITRK